MNYDANIGPTIDFIKADKSIIQPWRNKAVARLEEAQAFIRMGQTSTNLKPPAGSFTRITNEQIGQACICELGVIDRTCPVHGNGL